MATTDTSEKGLEALIVQSLVDEAGYVPGRSEDFDRDYAVDLAKLVAFLGATQPEAAEGLGLAEDGPSGRSSCTGFKGRSPGGARSACFAKASVCRVGRSWAMRASRDWKRTMGKKLRPSGGYRRTASFQTATIIYDATWWFCERFLGARGRMADQMVQAARSGRQNIAEGSRAAATSSQTELRLLNVARASLEELLLDYEDFLRHRHLPQWAPDSAEARAVRDVPREFGKERPDRANLTDLTDQERWALYAAWLEHAEPAVRANALICLIHQANFLLDQQIAAVEAQFVEEGGYSEQLAAARMAERQRRKEQKDPSDPSDPADPIPACPQCGKPMSLRTARTGRNAGSQFWGCTGYPDCKGVVSL